MDTLNNIIHVTILDNNEFETTDTNNDVAIYVGEVQNVDLLDHTITYKP